MKKLNLLMLLALTLLMFGCRTELSNEETSLTQSDFRKTIKLKEALAFKNYLTEIKNNPSNSYSKNEDFFSSLSDDATVTVITQNNVTSYSTVVRHLNRSSDVLVYSVDNENKSIGFTAKYKPSHLTKNYHIDNFTGTVEYTSMDGRPMGTRELVNGVPLAPKTAQQNTTASKVACSYSINLIEVNCNGDNHTPSQYAQCTANEKPYYIVEITEVCPSGGQPPKGFPNMGFYDGGGDSGGSTTSSEMSIQDSFNYMLNEAGFPELSAEEYTYIQNNQYIGGQLLSYFYNNLNQNNTQLLHWSIGYFNSLGNLGTNTITIWKEFESKLNFAQQFFANNPNTSWEKFENWFLKTNEGLDGDYDSTYWDNPNLSFPAQSLPSWNEFAVAYPKHNDPNFDTPEKMYQAAGNAIYNTYLTKGYRNTCALRISYAINHILGPDGKPKIKIPPSAGFKGNDGNYYFLSATALLKWMKATFVTPSSPYHISGSQGGQNGVNFPSIMSNLPVNNGIYIMIPNIPGGCPSPPNPQGTGFCASGHADLIQNGVCDGGCYFGALGGVKEIFVWPLQ